MPTEGLFSKTISLLERSLDLRSMNHRVLSSNIANMDTPNYKAIEMGVEEEMKRGRKDAHRGITLTKTHLNHLPVKDSSRRAVKFRAARAPDFSLRGDGNTVDIDRTMGQLSKNTLLFNTASQLISQKFKGLKNAIKGGTK